MNSRKLVVTGAGGFLGRHVLARFGERPWSVWSFCGQESEKQSIEALSQRTIVGGILEENLVDRWIEGSDAVVHLAGPPFVGESFQQPMKYAKVHILGTIAVVQACLRHRVRRLVYVSSAEVYGRGGTDDVTEDQPTRPQSPYASAKATAEQLISHMVSDSDMSVVILRPFSVYGPQGHQAALIPTIIRQVHTGDRVELANLAPIRDYCHVDDVARAVECAVECDVEGVVPINIGSGTGNSVRELAEIALRVARRDLPVVQRSASDRPRQNDIDRLVASIERAAQVLDWYPQIGIEDGLQQLLHECNSELTS